jgi:hypothetical protein
MLTVGRPWEVVVMSSQSRQSTQSPSASMRQSATLPDHDRNVLGQPALAFDRDEWELVVTLPRRVLLAAVAAAPADGRRAAEGIAGIEAIASGLASGSPLVREVVSAIYAESHHGSAEADADADVISVRTLAACRYAASVLAQRCSPQDAAAYREWLLHIAAVVTGVAQGIAAPADGGQRGPRGFVPSQFVYALDGVLRADQ